MTCVSNVPQNQVASVSNRLRGFGLVNITVTADGSGTFTVCGQRPGGGGGGLGMTGGGGAGATGGASTPQGLRPKMTHAAFTKLTEGNGAEGSSGGARRGPKTATRATRSAGGGAKGGGRSKAGGNSKGGNASRSGGTSKGGARSKSGGSGTGAGGKSRKGRGG